MNSKKMTSTIQTRKQSNCGCAGNRGVGFAAVLLAFTAAYSATQPSPKEVVESLTSRVLSILRDDGLDTTAKRDKVEEAILRNVDFETLSRLVMARNWRSLSAAQKTEFMELFRRHLSDTYGDNVDTYRNEEVLVLAERQEKRGDVTVKSKILRGGGEDILVDYRLRQRDGEWQIIDFVIEGVSLVANFRSQFQEIISNGGPERLLKLLREKGLEPPPTS